MRKPAPIPEMWVDIIDIGDSMNKDIKITWTFPSERAPGIPLSEAEINYTQVQHQVGNGPFQVSGNVPAPGKEFTLKDRPPGTYTIRALFTTNDEQNSPMVQGTVIVEETPTEPVPVTNPLENFTIELLDPS